METFVAITGAAIACYFARKIYGRVRNPKTFGGWLSNNGRDLAGWILGFWWLAIIVGIAASLLGLVLHW
jgi:hypothetical protein